MFVLRVMAKGRRERDQSALSRSALGSSLVNHGARVENEPDQQCGTADHRNAPRRPSGQEQIGNGSALRAKLLRQGRQRTDLVIADIDAGFSDRKAESDRRATAGAPPDAIPHEDCERGTHRDKDDRVDRFDRRQRSRAPRRWDGIAQGASQWPAPRGAAHGRRTCAWSCS